MLRSRTAPNDQSDAPKNFSADAYGSENSRLPTAIEAPHPNVYGMHAQPSNMRPAYDHYTHSIGPSQPNHHEHRDINRAHPKLQRQLSLNPNACDPRIQQRVQNAMNRQMGQSEQQQLVHHRLLSGSLSGPRSPNMSNHWDVHQVSGLHDFRWIQVNHQRKTAETSMII